MKILIVGNGGREHALAYALSGYRGVKLFATRPNAGMASLAQAIDIDPMDTGSLVGFAIENGVDLTVVGPEAPLAAGIVDLFGSHGLRIFGPTMAAARLESSKTFAHQVMEEAGVPTARWQVFEDYEQARDYCKAQTFPIVIKADGLAAGKGVTIAGDFHQAEQALVAAMKEKRFGNSGNRVVIEEFLEGQEMSFMAISDGEDVLPLPVSKDHKRAFNNDEGPNTGGMGAISPVPFVDQDMAETLKNRVILPVIQWMREHNTPFTGLLYAGLMLTAEGPKVLEFNVRFGDPETQAVLPRLHGDLVEALLGAAEGSIRGISLTQSKLASTVVVLSSGGYPGAYKRGYEINGLDITDPMVYVFHAGTGIRDKKVITTGGRVLGVMGLGDTLAEARKRAYAAVSKIEFQDMQFRTDIGLVS